MNISNKLQKINCILSETNGLYHKLNVELGLSDSIAGVLYALYANEGAYPIMQLRVELSMPKQTLNSALRSLEKDGVLYLEIYSKFSIDSSFRESKIAQEDTFDSFEIFLYVMNEVRNSAIHDGAYWEHFFNNHGDEPLLFQLKVNLHRYKGDQKKLHTFLTELSYQEFENIFVRTSIRLIRNYLKQHTNQQEEPSYADA